MIAAAIQMTSSINLEEGLSTSEALVREAAGEGAEFIALPEYFAYHGREDTWPKVAERSGDVLKFMGELARDLGVYLLAGATLIPSGREDKLANVSILFGPDGEEIGRYQKIRLFDVDTTVRKYRESRWLTPGDRLATAQVGDFELGFSICFDLRFPEHFLELRKMGAEVIAVPSAFTYETGKDHWMTLLRARAIETQCYVIAPALVGGPLEERRCFGNTTIIDPWGDIMGLREEGDGIVTASLSKEKLAETRRNMPIWSGRTLTLHSEAE